jgi:hypothetical protein
MQRSYEYVLNPRLMKYRERGEARSSQKTYCETIHLSAERLQPMGGEFADFFDSSPGCRGGKMWWTMIRLAEFHKPKGE